MADVVRPGEKAMKTIDRRNYRAMVIAALVAIGIASTLATGGGDGGSNIAPPPQPPTPPTLIDITVDNAIDVSTLVIEAIDLTFDVGDVVGGDYDPTAADDPTVIAAPDKVPGGLVTKPFAYDAEEIQGCANGGTVEITGAYPAFPRPGDAIRFVFDNCDDGDGFIISGQVDLTWTTVDGDVLTPFFRLGADVVLTDIEIIDGMETSTADGEFTLTLDALDWPTVSQTIEGVELVFGAGGEIITLTDFRHFLQVDGSMTPEAVTVTVEGRVYSSTFGGAVDYETPVPVQVMGDADPNTGEILITGNDGSAVRMIFNDATSITLEVDENGDGVIDEYIDTNWSELQGVTSTINSSTAPLVAHEAVNVVTGFGSVTVAAGAQFDEGGAFGQIMLMGVSGTFDPIEVACPYGGSAMVSGTIASAGTYGAGDAMVAAFTNCRFLQELLDGPIEFTVASYEQASGDAYLVSGSGTEPCLTRTTGDLSYNGCGDFETTYDGRFTSPSFVYFTATSADFTIAYDGMDRYLSNASVSGEIEFGPDLFVVIRRTSSGSFGGPGLGGRYAYESLVPDTLLYPGNSTIGPHSGELRVTADDGSTLTIVALDTENVRLDVDYDGDGSLDTSITTTWAELY
jgi:hypothetical protein